MDEESELLVDYNYFKDNDKNRKIRDGFQLSDKIKKCPLHDCSQTFDSYVGVDSDADSLASSQVNTLC